MSITESSRPVTPSEPVCFQQLLGSGGVATVRLTRGSLVMRAHYKPAWNDRKLGESHNELTGADVIITSPELPLSQFVQGAKPGSPIKLEDETLLLVEAKKVGDAWEAVFAMQKLALA